MKIIFYNHNGLFHLFVMFLNSSCKRKWKRRTWTRFKCSSTKRHYPLSSSLWRFHSTRAHTPSTRSSICKSRSSNGSAFSELAPSFSSLLSASIRSLVFRLRSRKIHSDFILSYNTWNSKLFVFKSSYNVFWVFEFAIFSQFPSLFGPIYMGSSSEGFDHYLGILLISIGKSQRYFITWLFKSSNSIICICYF